MLCFEGEVTRAEGRGKDGEMSGFGMHDMNSTKYQ